MKKLSYMALGLIGIMGTLSVGVVNAKSETIYITGFNGNTSGQLIQTNNQVWDDLELYLISNTGAESHYTIMDRNLGATEVFNLKFNKANGNRASYGYHYQWGNNFGFERCADTDNCTDFPNATTDSTRISSEIWSLYMPSQYARNKYNISKSVYNWMGGSSTTDNIWGGGGDTTTSNHDGILIGNDNDWSILSGRQGPCPNEYYIPSALDWSTLVNAYVNAGGITGTNDGREQFVLYLFLPPSGRRSTPTPRIQRVGEEIMCHSSSPHISNVNRSYRLDVAPGRAFSPLGEGDRNYGLAVRCAKGTPNTGFTVHANGGVKAMIAFRGTIGSGIFTTLGAPTRSDTGSVFVGWYDADTGGTKLNTGDTVVSDIYARWDCTGGYIDNGTACVPDERTVTLDYTTNGGTEATSGSTLVMSGQTLNLSEYTATKEGWDFVGWNTNSGANEAIANPTVTGDITLYAIFKKVLTATYTATNANIPGNQASGSCTLWNNDTSCSIPLPAAITCNAGYHSPIWTPASPFNITANDSATASCTQCAAGTYTAQGNTATSCTTCEAGYYCPVGAAKAECTGRTQYSEAGASACSTVSEGYYTTDCVSNNQCKGQSQCTAGTACSGGVQTSCVASTNTVAGTYSNSDGATSCTTADDGYYVTSAGATEQTECPAGSYCPGGKLISCPAGTTSVAGSTSESACKITCNAGEYLPKNTSSCQSCPAGKYCAGGEYGFSSSNDQGIGGDCNADTYSVGGASAATCTACPSGYKSAAGATGQVACYISVPAGQYLGTANGTGTTACASGTYKGAHNVNYGQTSSCTACPSGYTSEDGATGQVACYISVPAGQYLGTANGTGTTACASGTYKGAHNVNYGETSSCTTCGAGYYCPAGAGAGTACPSGYTSPEGASEENQCYQNKTSGGSSSGGGGGRSNKTSNTSKDDNTASNSQTDSQKDNNTQDSTNDVSEGQNNSEGTQKTYSDEFQNAYKFAKEHGITTMPTIEKADMEAPLTRIAMAKMLSYYAINVLGMKPDESRVNKFNDVTDELDSDYDGGVTLAYQLGIMGINMPDNKFRPNDLVPRAEFATALSRMLYSTSDGEYKLTPKYYVHHMEKLMEEKILTNDDPMMEELRGYVMIMLMRSAN